MVDGGYRVSGTFNFASGSRHATWLGGHVPIVRGRRHAAPAQRRRTERRTMLFPAASATMHDIWHVIGLRGTGSDSFIGQRSVRAPRALVSRATTPPSGASRRRSTASQAASTPPASPAWRWASPAACSTTSSRWRATRSRAATARTLRDSNVTQSRVAQAEAQLASARATCCHSLEEIWSAVGRRGHITLDERMTIRLAASFAIQQAREVVDIAYHAAGGTAIFTPTRSSAASATSTRSPSSSRAATTISKPSANTCSAWSPTRPSCSPPR